MQPKRTMDYNAMPNKEAKKILLLGASGLTGNFVLQELLRSSLCKSLILWGRKAPEAISEKILFRNNLDETLSCELTNVDAVICCLGTTIKKAGSKDNFKAIDYDLPLYFANMAKEKGVPVFCLMSSIGADAQSNNFYLKTKGGLEDAIKFLDFNKLHILQPSLLLGERKEYRAGERLGQMLAPLFNALLFGKMQKYKAIQSLDVAKALCFSAIFKSFDEQVKTYQYNQISALAQKWDQAKL